VVLTTGLDMVAKKKKVPSLPLPGRGHKKHITTPYNLYSVAHNNIYK